MGKSDKDNTAEEVDRLVTELDPPPADLADKVREAISDDDA